MATVDKFSWMKEVPQLELTAADFKVLICIFNYSDGQGRGAVAAVDRIRSDAGLSESAVKRSLRKLTKLGVIAQVRRGGRSGDGSQWASIYDLVPFSKGQAVHVEAEGQSVRSGSQSVRSGSQSVRPDTRTDPFITDPFITDPMHEKSVQNDRCDEDDYANEHDPSLALAEKMADAESAYDLTETHLNGHPLPTHPLSAQYMNLNGAWACEILQIREFTDDGVRRTGAEWCRRELDRKVEAG